MKCSFLVPPPWPWRLVVSFLFLLAWGTRTERLTTPYVVIAPMTVMLLPCLGTTTRAFSPFLAQPKFRIIATLNPASSTKTDLYRNSSNFSLLFHLFAKTMRLSFVFMEFLFVSSGYTFLNENAHSFLT